MDASCLGGGRCSSTGGRINRIKPWKSVEDINTNYNVRHIMFEVVVLGSQLIALS